MADKSNVAPLVAKFARDQLGVSTAQLQRLTDADLDVIVNLFKSGPPRRKFRAGGFYGPHEGNMSTNILTEDVEVASPILVEEFCIVEEIGVDVTTAGSEGSLWVTLRRDRGDGYPGAAVHKSAALAVTTGFKSTASLAVELTPGLYWGTVVCNGVTTTVATVTALKDAQSLYVSETAGANDADVLAYKSPATVTSTPPDDFDATVATEVFAPRVLLKIKSF